MSRESIKQHVAFRVSKSQKASNSWRCRVQPSQEDQHTNITLYEVLLVFFFNYFPRQGFPPIGLAKPRKGQKINLTMKPRTRYKNVHQVQHHFSVENIQECIFFFLTKKMDDSLSISFLRLRYMLWNLGDADE